MRGEARRSKQAESCMRGTEVMKIGSDATVEMLRSWEGGTELPLSLSLVHSENNLAHYTSLDGRTDGRKGTRRPDAARNFGQLPLSVHSHRVTAPSRSEFASSVGKSPSSASPVVAGPLKSSHKTLNFSGRTSTRPTHPVQFLPWRRFGFTARKSPSVCLSVRL